MQNCCPTYFHLDTRDRQRPTLSCPSTITLSHDRLFSPSLCSIKREFCSFITNKMADTTDPAINEGHSFQSPSWLSVVCSFLIGLKIPAYLDVRNDKSETNWLLLDYESDRSEKLVLTRTGSGGLSELKESIEDSKASYAYVRVTYSNDKESTREKFILVVRPKMFSPGNSVANLTGCAYLIFPTKRLLRFG